MKESTTAIKICYAIFKLGEEIRKNKNLNNSKKIVNFYKKSKETESIT